MPLLEEGGVPAVEAGEIQPVTDEASPPPFTSRLDADDVRAAPAECTTAGRRSWRLRDVSVVVVGTSHLVPEGPTG